MHLLTRFYSNTHLRRGEGYSKLSMHYIMVSLHNNGETAIYLPYHVQKLSCSCENHCSMHKVGGCKTKTFPWTKISPSPPTSVCTTKIYIQ